GVMGLVRRGVRGAPPLLLTIRHGDPAQWLGGRSVSGQLLDTIYSLVWLVPAALIAVGFPRWRSLRGALDRLGVVRPTGSLVALAAGIAVALALASAVLDQAIGFVWRAAGWPTTDTSSLEQLMAYTLSPLGAVVVGLSAGIGEELAVRGVLQPRLGLLLSNLFFTSLHAFQYGPDALLGVFLIRLVLRPLPPATHPT